MFVNDKHSAITLFCSVINFHVVLCARLLGELLTAKCIDLIFTNRLQYVFQGLNPMLLGNLRSEDGDGRENVAEKMNSRFLNLHRDYSIKSLTLSNVGEPS